MKWYKQQHKCILWNILFLFVHLLPSTIAFVHKRNACARLHHRRVDESSFRCGGNSNNNSDPSDNRFGQGGDGGVTERQDAYGRTIQNDGNPEASDESIADPLAATSTFPDSNHRINLDPLVVCGPSGVGKGTVIESLRKRFPPNAFGFGVSHTTRQPRPGEIDGQHYYFTTVEEIQTDIDGGSFVEHAKVHGNYYGTSKQAIEVLQSEHKITILDIDVQGVVSVKESGMPSKYVFIAPPSMAELEDRLRGRGTETEEAISKRLGNAASEIEYGRTKGNFDRVFVNENVESTVDEMVDVLLEWFPQLKKSDSTAGTDADLASDTEKKAGSPPKQPPFDFLAESEKMMRFPSVRKGHGKLEVTDRNPDEQRGGKEHGYYTVDLEEPESPRGYPRLGTTNPTIVLDDQGGDSNNEKAY